MPQKKYFPPRNLETKKWTVFGEPAFTNAVTAYQMISNQLIDMFDIYYSLDSNDVTVLMFAFLICVVCVCILLFH